MRHPIRKHLRSLRFTLCLLPIGALSLTGQEVSEETETNPEFDADSLMYSMGFVMASQIDLQIGLSERELELLLSGMRDQATGVPKLDNYNDRVSAVRDLFVTRRTAHQKVLNEENIVISTEALAKLKAEKGLKETDSGLLYEIVEPGDQDLMPVPEDNVTLSYEAFHLDKNAFDSAKNLSLTVREKPNTLPGLIEGIQLIGEGGRAILYLPSDLAFGARPPSGATVQPGEALIFDVSLARVTKKMKPQLPVGFDPSSIPSAPPSAPPSGPPAGPPPTLPDHIKVPTAPPPAPASAE